MFELVPEFSLDADMTQGVYGISGLSCIDNACYVPSR